MVRQNIETVAGALELFVIRIVWEKILILLARAFASLHSAPTPIYGQEF